jgi:hypothetical protein
MKKIGSLAALFLLAVLPLHAQMNGVSAELQLAQDEYLPGEDLQLSVRIMNRSGQEIILGEDNDWLSLSIIREDGVPAPRISDMPLQGEFSLLSGEVGTRTLNPTPFFDFHQMGRYRIRATIRIPQWGQEVAVRGVSFTVGNGVALPKLENLQFGMQPSPGATNVPPQVRSYTLLRANQKNLTLYFKLTDGMGKILRVYPLARMISFSDPEAQIDRYNNLHVLSQTGARAFFYGVINPDGQLITRQTYVYYNTRPMLGENKDGWVYVTGGARRLSMDDLPPVMPESAQK